MGFEKVLENLRILENEPSTNKKVELLRVFLRDRDFLLVTKYALSGDMKYHIQKVPVFKNMIGLNKPDSNDEIFKYLRKLSKQPGASNADKKGLYNLLFDEHTHEVVKRICKKDLRCGVSAKLVNKALPGTVNTIPYMRCSTEKKIDNIRYEAIIQEKADGMYAACMINNKGQIKFVTRNGKTVYQLGHLKKIILVGRLNRTPKNKKITEKYGIFNNSVKKEYHMGMVFTGELVVIKNGKVLDRKTGNGILNSCIHGTASKEDAQCVAFRIWDCLPLDKFYNGYYPVAYNTRIFNSISFVNAINDREFVDIVMTKRVNSYEEAHDFYAEIRKAGGEGAILKNIDAVWKDHTSTDMIKMKNISEAELVIVGWESGKEGTKYELCMGAINCVSKDEKISVSVGSGFSDEQRELDWDKFIGKIVTVEFESVIQDKRTKKHSLFLPRFKEFREDRDVADTFKEITER